jgi:hypothetical protein
MTDELDDACVDGRGHKVSIMCPVCGGRLSDQLPDKEGVLTELFRAAENTRIVNADVIIERIKSTDIFILNFSKAFRAFHVGNRLFYVLGISVIYRYVEG